MSGWSWAGSGVLHVLLLVILLWHPWTLTVPMSVMPVELVSAETVAPAAMPPSSTPLSPPVHPVRHPTPVPPVPVPSVPLPKKTPASVVLPQRHRHPRQLVHRPILPTLSTIQQLLAHEAVHRMGSAPRAVVPAAPIKHPVQTIASSAQTTGVVTNPSYARQLQAHIYQFAVLPWQSHAAGPVTFLVHQDVHGRVITIEKRHGSGIPAYDDALYRAIVLASPLPLPDHPEDFQSAVLVTFYPGEPHS